MKLMYVADDGKEFDTADSCLAYERAKIDPLCRIKSVVRAFKDDGTEIIPDEEEDIILQLEEIYQDSDYLIVSRDLTNEEIKALHDYVGVTYPHYKGIYRWDNETWVSFGEDMQFIHDNWQPMKQFLPYLTIF